MVKIDHHMLTDHHGFDTGLVSNIDEDIGIADSHAVADGGAKKFAVRENAIEACPASEV